MTTGMCNIITSCIEATLFYKIFQIVFSVKLLLIDTE